MTGNLALTEFLFLSVSMIGYWIMWEFIKLKEKGILPVIMATFFGVMSFMYLIAGLYFYMRQNALTALSGDTFRIIFVTPKFLVMCWLLYYLKSTKSK